MSGLLGLVLFALSMSATPGPNNVMVTSSGATYGFRRTLPHVLGISVGFPVMVLLVGLGLGSVFVAYPVVHKALKIVGVAYMLWLAARIAMAGRPEVNAANGRARPLTFFEAAAFQWVNPKAWIIAVAAVATYAGLAGNLWVETVMIAGVFMFVTLPAVSGWAMIGSGVGAVLSTDRQFRLFNGAMAALLVLSLIPMIWER